MDNFPILKGLLKLLRKLGLNSLHLGVFLMLIAAFQGIPGTNFNIKDHYWNDAIGFVGLLLVCRRIFPPTSKI